MHKIYQIGVSLLAVALLGGSWEALAQDRSQAVRFDIAAQPVGPALNEFGKQTGLHVVVDADLASGVKSPGVRGTYLPEAALGRLLGDTGLKYRFVDEDTVAVVGKEGEAKLKAELAGGEEGVRVSQGGTGSGGAGASGSGQGAGEKQNAATTAESSDGVKLEEVVVTAQKREEKLRDVPMSIVATSGEALEAARIDSLAEIQRAVPGFTFKEGITVDSSSLFIRGIGTFVFSDTVEPSVGSVIDGVVMGRAGLGLFNFNDVDRVEVLRGPQGTLFGMNSSAGVVNIVTKDPTQELSGSFGASYGTYDEVKVNGAISGALIDDVLLARLSFFKDKRDGYVHNLFDGRDINGDDQKGARIKLLFTPREQTRIALNADIVDRDRDCCIATVMKTTDPLLADIARVGNNKINGPGNVYARDKSRGASLQWDETIGDYALTSITAYRSWDDSSDYTYFNTTPAGGIATETGSPLEVRGQHQLTQELRVASPKGGRVDFVAGAFLFRQKLFADIDQLLFSTLRYLTHEDDKRFNYAGFGEANFHLGNNFTLLAGARWTHDTLDTHPVNPPVPPDQIDISPVYFGKSSVTDTNWSWRTGLQWKPDADDTFYLTVSRGYKAPLFSIQDPSKPQVLVRPEIATNYELGLKSQFFENRLRTNLALFNTIFRDFQGQAGIQIVPDSAALTFVVVNAGKLRSRGAELELEAVPTRHLMINLNATYIDGKFTDYVGAPCYIGQTVSQGCIGGAQDLSGARLPNVPRWSVNGSVSYDVALASMPFDAFVRGDYSWRDKVQWDSSQSPAAVEGAYGLLGASIGIQDKGDRYTVRVYGNNLTNQMHTNGLSAFGVLNVWHELPPDYKRTYGVAFDYRFGQ